jgi:hypothetical protein
MARNADWYRTAFADDVFEQQWTVLRMMQYGGHVVGTGARLWLLARYGRRWWMAQRADAVAPFPVTATSRAELALVHAGRPGHRTHVAGDGQQGFCHGHPARGGHHLRRHDRGCVPRPQDPCHAARTGAGACVPMTCQS